MNFVVSSSESCVKRELVCTAILSSNRLLFMLKSDKKYLKVIFEILTNLNVLASYNKDTIIFMCFVHGFNMN